MAQKHDLSNIYYCLGLVNGIKFLQIFITFILILLLIIYSR